MGLGQVKEGPPVRFGELMVVPKGSKGGEMDTLRMQVGQEDVRIADTAEGNHFFRTGDEMPSWVHKARPPMAGSDNRDGWAIASHDPLENHKALSRTTSSDHE